MTTRTYSSVCDPTSTAGFRAICSEFLAEMTAAGLVQTADTGQINPATVVVPALNTAAGYFIFRFNDALQATAPVYIKIEIGVGARATWLGMWVTVGTGTNGAGTITGIGHSRTIIGHNQGHANPYNIVTPYTSYICVKDGYLFFLLKDGRTVTSGAAYSPYCDAVYALARTSNQSTGANDGTGIVALLPSNAAGGNSDCALYMKCANYLTGETFENTSQAGSHTFNPMGLTSTLVAGVPQVHRHFYFIPKSQAFRYACTVLITEFTGGSTFSEELVVAGDAETYLVAGNVLYGGYGHTSGARACFAWS